MVLDYVVDSPEASHLVDTNINGGDFFLFTGFSYDFNKYVDYYN